MSSSANESFYRQLFLDLRLHLLRDSPVATKNITRSVKRFFRSRYDSSHKVLCSDSDSSEYLTDVLVTTFDPKSAVQKKTLNISTAQVSAFLAVESELGGVSASSGYGVMKNVVEDFLKLLMIRCEYRVMVFTSLPFKNEEEFIASRAATLRDLYARSPGLTGGVLLVHLAGSQPRSKQVQARVGVDSIRGFIISSKGDSMSEVTDLLGTVDELA